MDFLSKTNYNCEVKTPYILLAKWLCSDSLLIQIGCAHFTAALFRLSDRWSLSYVIVNHTLMKLSLCCDCFCIYHILWIQFCCITCLVVLSVKHQSPGLLHAHGSPFVAQSYDGAEMLLFLQINGGSKTLVVPGQIMEGFTHDINCENFSISTS
jgi:hypothetical protein